MSKDALGVQRCTGLLALVLGLIECSRRTSKAVSAIFLNVYDLLDHASLSDHFCEKQRG